MVVLYRTPLILRQKHTVDHFYKEQLLAAAFVFGTVIVEQVRANRLKFIVHAQNIQIVVNCSL